MDALPDFIHFLMDPSVYGQEVKEVRLVQTHISYVLLAGDFVYKFKKPINFGFLDFTSLEKRKYFCEQELVLNRRLCPAIYLDLVSITATHKGKLEFCGCGEPVEFGIKMVHMPEECMMGNLIRAGRLTREKIDAIVETLEPFYDQAASGSELEKYGTVRAVGANVLGNLEQSRPFIGCQALSRGEFDKIETYVKKVLKNKELFARRIAGGRIKDGHGDLHSANICLADKVYIYDCIEFNHRLRCGDVANDIAFLAMDLDYYGLEGLSDYFIKRFMVDTDDQGLTDVLCFYKCYRATVRGKIGLLTAHEDEVDDRTRSEVLAQAARYFLLAQRYAEQCPVV